jgi:hypothetical protein
LVLQHLELHVQRALPSWASTQFDCSKESTGHASLFSFQGTH